MNKYIFLQGEVPRWVSDRLMLYLRADGKTGYEIDTGKYFKVIFKGDVLIKQGPYIKVVRGDCCDTKQEVDGKGK